jgi:hypothetical protein
MRPISTSGGLSITFNHAGISGEGLTTASINIPIDGNKYITGANIIECIQELLLPNLNIDAITQELTDTELNLLAGYAITGTISPYIAGDINKDSTVMGNAFNALANDNAALGILSLVEGQTKITYTP